MKNLFKIELKRALKSKSMLFALAIGSFITISYVIQFVIPASMGIDEVLQYNKSKMYCPPTIFVGWIGNAGYSMHNFLFYMLLPILATIPFADSFFLDRKNGYIKNVLIRAKKRDYYISKYLATFISGGLAIVIPLLISLVITAMFLPSYPPQAREGYLIGAAQMWGELFFIHPFIYILGYLIIDFIFSGFLATIALSISLVVEYRFMVIIAPFLIYLFLYSLLSSLGLNNYEPLYFLQPGYGTCDYRIILYETLFLGIITSTTFLISGVREDIY